MTHTPDIMEKARELEEKLFDHCVKSGGKWRDHVAREIIAAALAEARAVPDDWKLVPVEPTVSMNIAGMEARKNRKAEETLTYITGVQYKAMIAAAPNPPIAGGGE